MYNNPNYPGVGNPYAPNQFRQGENLVKGTLNKEEDEQIKYLSPSATFNLKPTVAENIKGKCNHHWADGSMAIDPEAFFSNHPTECNRCHKLVTFTQMTSDEARTVIEATVSILETIKFTNYTMPPNAVRELFGNLIPFLEKVPDLYDRTLKEMDILVGGGNMYGVNYNTNGFRVYNELNNGGMVGQPMMYNGGMVGPGPDPNAMNYQHQQQQYNPMPGTPMPQQQQYNPMPGTPMPQQQYNQSQFYNANMEVYGQPPQGQMMPPQPPQVNYIPGQPFTGTNSAMGGESAFYANGNTQQQNGMIPQQQQQANNTNNCCSNDQQKKEEAVNIKNTKA